MKLVFLNRLMRVLVFGRFICISLVLLSLTGHAQQETVKIGLIFSRDAYNDQTNGARLAVDQFKPKYFKIDAKFLDDGCNKESAETLAKSLLQSEVRILVGVPCPTATLVVAKLTEAARVAFVSTSPLYGAEGKSTPADTLHFAPSFHKAEQLAKGLSDKSKLVVVAHQRCFEDFLPPKEFPKDAVAIVCPMLSVKEREWKSFRNLYHGKYGQEPSIQALIGYSATQVALQAAQSDGHGGNASDAQAAVLTALSRDTFETVLGKVSKLTPPIIDSTLIVIPNPASKKDIGKVSSALAKTKSCDQCSKKGECPQTNFEQLIFVSKAEDCCKKNGECPQSHMIIVQ